MNRDDKPLRDKNPREDASALSIVIFFFTYTLFKKGNKKELEDTDVYEILPSFSSDKLGNNIEQVWLNEEITKKNPSLLAVLITCYGKTYLLLGVVQLCLKVFITFMLPQSMGKLVAYFQPDQSDITRGDLYKYASLVVGLKLINIIYSHNYDQLTTELGLKIRTSLAALIYRKALRMNQSSLSSFTTGRMVTFITKDISAFETIMSFLNDIFIGVVQTGIITYIIYCRIGWSVFVGIGFFILIIPLQVFMGKCASIKRISSAKTTDKRLQLSKEVFSSIKNIKMFTWEKYFHAKISNLRKKEIYYIGMVYYIKCIILVTGTLVSSTSFFLLIMVYVWTGNYVDAETVYFIQSCFSMLSSYVSISIPYGITLCAEVSASLKRLQEFLRMDNTDVSYLPRTATKPVVTLEHVLSKINNKIILKDVSLQIEKGLLLISGNVGSGKTSVLKVILGEYPINGGELIVDGSISYACQDPWLFPSSIKQNILFGEPFNEKRYNEVLSVCALQFDLKQFKKGDQTIVGDKAVNLSKGQQARINLARAVYKNSDIYLLDDCLSGLDIQVNMYIYKKCIMEFLRDKIVLLVTNNTNHLKLAYEKKTVCIKYGMSSIPDQRIASFDNITDCFIDDTNYVEEYKVEDLSDCYYADQNIKLLENDEDYNGKDFYHEKKQSGKVNITAYLRFYKSAGGFFVALLIVSVFVLSTAVQSYSDKLVSKWVNIEPNVSSLVKENLTNTTLYHETVDERNFILNLYCAMIFTGMSLVVLRTYITFFFALRVSKKLHKMLVQSVLNAFMTFFDNHYIGNIVNRFSKDFYTIDESIPSNIYEMLRCTLTFMGIIYLVASVYIYFLVPGILLVVVIYMLRRFYITTGRTIKRLESATRSPMIGYMNASLEGITTIRAFEKQSLLIQEFDEHLDLYTSAYYMLICTTRTFSFCLDMASLTFSVAVILIFVFMDTDSQAGDVGLAISQALGLIGMLPWTVRQYSDIENNMTAVERVLEYTDIGTEQQAGQFKDNWPSKGKIEFKNVCMTYTKAKELVLKHLNFTIHPCEKIGIIGRTGAGKSSIISGIFRLYDFDGRILIDDVDTKTLPLEFLRSSIAIIPQDPILFSGTIRSNLDPDEKYSDLTLTIALNKVNLHQTFLSLDEQITDNGSAYSSGQRQLICLARALISKNKIIILDEATSSMDPKTCLQLQTIISNDFGDCTILTIAHKLTSVLKSDRIMVVDNGEIVEFDSPTVLQNNRNSMYRNMIKQSGIDIFE